jgi:hypothetical protein
MNGQYTKRLIRCRFHYTENQDFCPSFRGGLTGVHFVEFRTYSKEYGKDILTIRRQGFT